MANHSCNSPASAKHIIFWAEHIHNKPRTIESMKIDFSRRLHTHLQVNWTIALRDSTRIELKIDSNTKDPGKAQDTSHLKRFKDIWCFDSTTIRCRGSRVEVDESIFNPPTLRQTTHEIWEGLMPCRANKQTNRKAKANNTHKKQYHKRRGR